MIDLIEATTKPMFSRGQETGPHFKNTFLTYSACSTIAVNEQPNVGIGAVGGVKVVKQLHC